MKFPHTTSQTRLIACVYRRLMSEVDHRLYILNGRFTGEQRDKKAITTTLRIEIFSCGGNLENSRRVRLWIDYV